MQKAPPKVASGNGSGSEPSATTKAPSGLLVWRAAHIGMKLKSTPTVQGATPVAVTRWVKWPKPQAMSRSGLSPLGMSSSIAMAASVRGSE